MRVSLTRDEFTFHVKLKYSDISATYTEEFYNDFSAIFKMSIVDLHLLAVENYKTLGVSKFVLRVFRNDVGDISHIIWVETKVDDDIMTLTFHKEMRDEEV